MTPETIDVKCPNQYLCYLIGLLFHLINKYRHSIVGYKTPRDFSSAKLQQSVQYVIHVVSQWEETLNKFLGNGLVFENKDILELGPGPDLGTGIVLLALGAKRYTAYDRFNLVGQTPMLFYELLLRKLRSYPFFERAQNAVEKIRFGDFSEDFLYIVDKTYIPAKRLFGRYDIVVSQAVMEHLDNPYQIIKEIYKKMKVNGVILSEVDAATHTRILRNIDPLNIYRYSDFIWSIFKFKGAPNRILPSEYKKMLIDIGFEDVKIEPIKIYNDTYVIKTMKFLSAKFRKASVEDLKIKSFLLFGVKKKENYGSSNNYNL